MLLLDNWPYYFDLRTKRRKKFELSCDFLADKYTFPKASPVCKRRTQNKNQRIKNHLSTVLLLLKMLWNNKEGYMEYLWNDRQIGEQRWRKKRLFTFLAVNVFTLWRCLCSLECFSISRSVFRPPGDPRRISVIANALRLLCTLLPQPTWVSPDSSTPPSSHWRTLTPWWWHSGTGPPSCCWGPGTTPKQSVSPGATCLKRKKCDRFV